MYWFLKIEQILTHSVTFSFKEAIMANSKKTDSSNTSLKWYNSITTQTITLNIILYAVIIMIFIIASGSIGKLTDIGSNIIQYSSGLLSSESDLQMGVSEVHSRLNSYLTVKGKRQKDIADIIKENEEKIDNSYVELEKFLKLNPDKNIEASIATLKTLTDKLKEDTAKTMSQVQSNDSASALATFSNTVTPEVNKVQSALVNLKQLTYNATDTARSNMHHTGVASAGQMTFFIVLSLIVLLINSSVSYFAVMKKIQQISGELKNIDINIKNGNGDLTARINTKTNSEILYIKNGVNNLIASLQTAMRDVKDSTVKLNNNADSILRQIGTVNDNITNTSASLEELSASMETVSNNTEDMHAKVNDIREAADAINDEAAEGDKTAESIKKEADSIKASAEKKKNDTGVKTKQLGDILSLSVKDSEKVKQIDALTKTILDIASQTNLLALNASIEAARAGEAGKGFAVVAGEISQLAAHSRETASNIQEISKDVTAAVTNLSDNAINVIDYINTTVIPDYDSYVEIGSKYEKTADLLKATINKFTEKAGNLDVIVEEMTIAMDTISDSVSQSSRAISSSADNSTQIVEQVQAISEAIDDNSTIINELVESTEKYKKL